jgi:hypothetical protein
VQILEQLQTRFAWTRLAANEKPGMKIWKVAQILLTQTFPLFTQPSSRGQKQHRRFQKG